MLINRENDKEKITFSFTSSSASTNSSDSCSPVLATVEGRSQASLIDFRPKNNKRVTAAYSPIGNAVRAD